MTQVCRGLCKTVYKKPPRHTNIEGTIYRENVKRCNGECDDFVEWDGIWCPCCGRKLKSQRRNKAKFLDSKLPRVA